MKKIAYYAAFAFLGMTAVSCGGNADTKVPAAEQETATKGNIEIAVDETYRPVFEQQLQVFDTSYPEANITPRYNNEADCIQALFDKKVKMIVISRDLTPEEQKALVSRKIYVKSLEVAKDAIAVINNPKSSEKALTIGQLQSILLGQFKNKYNVVFDSNKGGIVRYVNDTLLKGQTMGANVFASKNADSVIDYVSKNPDAIGFVGSSYVYDPNSTVGYGEFKKDIQVVKLKRDDDTINAVQPYQAAIALKDYPMVRPMYVIYLDVSNLASGFTNFLASERGQLIFNQARMYPTLVQLIIREAAITE